MKINLGAVLAGLVLFAHLVLYVVAAAIPLSCQQEDSTRTRLGTPGCVWFGPVQGDGRGHVVVNGPWMD